jgi:hypothetical protein
MQIALAISLSEYIDLTLDEIHGLFVHKFSKKCPICGAENCAVFLGFYYRNVYVFTKKLKVRIPVIRFLCRRLNSKSSTWNSTHRTFSLLPAEAIPYHLLDMDSLLFIVSQVLAVKTYLDISSDLAAQPEQSLFCSSSAFAFYYFCLFRNSAAKAYCLKLIKSSDSPGFLAFLSKRSPLYLFLPKVFKKHLVFLFGTPSQVRFP